MPLFFYKALTPEGQTVEGRLDAKDRFAVYRKVKSDRQSILFVKEEFAAKARILARLRSIFGKVSSPDRINLAKNLGAMISAGLPLTRALGVMERQTKNKKLKAILSALLDSVSRGKTLSESMKAFPDVFSTLFVSMVKAGEESGNLAESLRIIGLQLEKIYTLTRKIRGAMIYPAIIVTLIIVIGGLMMIYMVPTLTATFQGLGVELPLSTRVIIAMSDFLRSQITLVGLGFLLIVAGILWFRRSARGRRFFDSLLLSIPIISEMVKEVNAARAARTLSSLLSSGVDVVIAMGVTQEVIQNTHFKRVLAAGQSAVERGDPMSSIFAASGRLFPPFVAEMMSVGEETGKMAEMLLNVAVFYEETVDQKTKDMSTLIEPLLMIFIGVVVGIFAISMLAPTYSLVEKI